MHIAETQFIASLQTLHSHFCLTLDLDFASAPSPVVDVGFVFDGFLQVFGQVGKEGDAGNALHLVDAVDIEVFLGVAVGVAADKANAFRTVTTQADNHLEEGIGDNYLVVANGLLELTEEERTANDIYLAIFLRPSAAGDFNLVPRA